MLPVVRGLILSFGPPEFLLLCVWGLTTIALVGRSDPMKSLAMAGLGLVLALVGMDPRTAEPRFTLGTDYLPTACRRSPSCSACSASPRCSSS